MPDSGSDVLPLNRWRALLARARQPRRRLELLLNDPAAPIIVPEIPEEEFYYLAKGVGAGDVGELLALAAPEQVRTCLDLDVWDHDQLALQRLVPWCEALEKLEPSRMAAVVRELDIELLALIFNLTAVIHEHEPVDDAQTLRKHPVFESPDGFFVVEFVGRDRELGRVLERFLQRLYNSDQDLGRNVLLEARVGLPSELAEASYHWRSSRLADLGFIPPDEAGEVYHWIDPATVQVPATMPPPARTSTETVGLPAIYAETLGEDAFVARVLATVDHPGSLELLTAHLVMLLNRVLSADQVDPSELETVAGATARARDTLSLGLEYLSDGDLDRARIALQTLSLPIVFRTGFSLLLPLQRRARLLRDAGSDEPDLLPLLAPRPEFPRSLDDPPHGGQRPFRSRDDLRRAGERLDEIAAAAPPA